MALSINRFCIIFIFFSIKAQLDQNITTIQQIGPLFCFGQNIIPMHNAVLRAIPFYQKQTSKKISFMSEQLIYGMLDKWIILLDLPVVFKDCGYVCSKGIGAFRVQTEYAYYKASDESKSIQATVLINGLFPNFKSTESTPLTKGASSFFCGTTASYLSNWYFYGSLGFRHNGSFEATKFGNQLLYEWIVGHKLPDIFCFNSYLLIEFNGLFSQKNKIKHISDINTGSNLIYAGPVLSLTSVHWGILAGIQGLILQHLNGDQQKYNFRAALMIAYKF